MPWPASSEPGVGLEHAHPRVGTLVDAVAEAGETVAPARAPRGPSCARGPGSRRRSSISKASWLAPPWRAPDSAPMPASTAEPRSAPVEITTSAAKRRGVQAVLGLDDQAGLEGAHLFVARRHGPAPGEEVGREAEVVPRRHRLARRAGGGSLPRRGPRSSSRIRAGRRHWASRSVFSGSGMWQAATVSMVRYWASGWERRGTRLSACSACGGGLRQLLQLARSSRRGARRRAARRRAPGAPPPRSSCRARAAPRDNRGRATVRCSPSIAPTAVSPTTRPSSPRS